MPVVTVDVTGIAANQKELKAATKAVIAGTNKEVKIQAEKVMKVTRSSKDIWNFVANPEDLEANPPIKEKRTPRTFEAIKKVSAPIKRKVGTWAVVHAILYARPKPPREPELEKGLEIREDEAIKAIEDKAVEEVEKRRF